jgi:16S rRNA (cytosine967-C5)-methyltransferase
VAARTAAYAARALPEPDRTAMHWGYHPQFVATLSQALGADHAVAAMTYLNQRGPLTLRVNRMRSSRDAVATLLRRDGIDTIAVPVLDDALWVAQAARITATTAYADGLVEIQDEGSQRIVAAAGAEPGQLVLDWCAGAGGKTLALAAQMALGTERGRSGRLIACDTHPQRLAECQRRAQRSGVPIEVRTLDHSSKALGDLAGRADLVLVDAPCSSSGALRRNPELRWHLDAAWLGRFASQQLAILQRAAAHVRPGGRLVYATCSLMPDENEGVVAAFLQGESQFVRTDEARIGPASAAWLATHPLAQFGPDGFYWCVLRRREPARRRDPAAVAPPDLPPA